jgi:hypothetical protein
MIAVVVCTEVLSRHLPGITEEKHETPQSRQPSEIHNRELVTIEPKNWCDAFDSSAFIRGY